MKNWSSITLIILLAVVLFILFRMNKTISLQSTLLIGMAGKLGVKTDDESAISLDKEFKPETIEATDEQKEQMEEKILVEGMLDISGRIKNKEEISAEDQMYYKMNFEDMHEDLNLANPSDIISQSSQAGEDGFEKKKLSRAEKKSLVMNLFVDGIPKQLAMIAEVLAKEAGIKANKGNTSVMLKEMIEERVLATYFRKKDNNLFYTLPSWMDGKKLKPQYLEKI